MKELPADVALYSASPKEGEYTKGTFPAGLIKEHTTKAGTWGIVRVSTGRLQYTIKSPGAEEEEVIYLDASSPGVIEPQVPHELLPLSEDVAFTVEFYKSGGNGSTSAAAAPPVSWSAEEGGEQKPVRYKRVPRIKGGTIQEVPVAAIRRPLAKNRPNDQVKVKWLMESIAEVGLKVPIDVLEVEGEYYGFSGCHRFEAHQRLGYETVRCRVRKASRQTLLAHLK